MVFLSGFITASDPFHNLMQHNIKILISEALMSVEVCGVGVL